MKTKRPISFILAVMCTVVAICFGSSIAVYAFSLGVPLSSTTVYIFVGPVLLSLVAVNISLTPNKTNAQIKCVVPILILTIALCFDSTKNEELPSSSIYGLGMKYLSYVFHSVCIILASSFAISTNLSALKKKKLSKGR